MRISYQTTSYSHITHIYILLWVLTNISPRKNKIRKWILWSPKGCGSTNCFVTFNCFFFRAHRTNDLTKTNTRKGRAVWVRSITLYNLLLQNIPDEILTCLLSTIEQHGAGKKKLDERYISACRQNIRSKPAQDRATHKPVSAARATKRTVRCICHPPLKQLLLNIRAVPRIVCQQSHSRWKSSLSAVRRQFPRA